LRSWERLGDYAFAAHDWKLDDSHVRRLRPALV
jgi:hypothetical protein